MTLSTLVRQCLLYLANTKKRSPGTVRCYERSMSQFMAYLQGRSLEDAPRHFNPEIVQAWCADLGNRGADGSTVNNKLYALSALAKFMKPMKDGRGKPLIEADPTKGLDRPEAKKPETLFLYPEELQLLLKLQLPPYLALLRALVMDCYIRRLEVAEASVGDLVEIKGKLHLTLKVKGRRKKGEERASVPLSDEFAELLKGTLAERQAAASEPLLVDRNGRRWADTQITETFIRMGKKAGVTRLTTSPHRVRHTMATLLANDGVDDVTLAALLNHRGTGTVQRYKHLVPGSTQAARDQQHRSLKKYLGGSAA